MKYQFKISKFIQDKSTQSISDNLLINIFKSNWLYRLQDRIFEFEEDEDYIIDDNLIIVIRKDWCIPYIE